VIRRVLRPDSTAIDIGANFGNILRDIVKTAPRGRHHAFEPLPELPRILRRRFPNVVIHEVALSNRVGTMSFMRVRDDLGLSGFHPTHRKASRLECDSISVRTDRLDAIIGSDKRIDLIKVDVEGAEFWVFDGARELLSRDRPVVLFESGISASRSYDGSTPESIHRLLTACGLNVSLMKHWLAGQPSLTEAEFVEEVRSAKNFYFMAHAAGPDDRRLDGR
jgi:FkbM family methyltransferase